MLAIPALEIGVCPHLPAELVGCAKSPARRYHPARPQGRFCARCRALGDVAISAPKNRRRDILFTVTLLLDRVRKIALDAVPSSSASQGDFAHPTTTTAAASSAGEASFPSNQPALEIGVRVQFPFEFSDRSGVARRRPTP